VDGAAATAVERAAGRARRPDRGRAVRRGPGGAEAALGAAPLGGAGAAWGAAASSLSPFSFLLNRRRSWPLGSCSSRAAKRKGRQPKTMGACVFRYRFLFGGRGDIRFRALDTVSMRDIIIPLQK
jgi:hypothetical protein